MAQWGHYAKRKSMVQWGPLRADQTGYDEDEDDDEDEDSSFIIHHSLLPQHPSLSLVLLPRTFAIFAPFAVKIKILLEAQKRGLIKLDPKQSSGGYRVQPLE